MALLLVLIAALLQLAPTRSAEAARRCGGLNQRPCKVWERIPSCNRGLVENFRLGRCVRPARRSIRRSIRRPVRRPVGRPIRRPVRVVCGGFNQRACKVWERIPSCNRGLREVRGRCVRPARRPVRRPVRVVCGGLNQRACKVWERVPSCNRGLREVRGRCVQPARRRVRVVCGGLNQRPCTVWERVPSCNRGLVENFRLGRCVQPVRRPVRVVCGGTNQRACKVWERVPSCNRGLREIRGYCRQPTQLGCGAINQPACKIWERVPSCDRGLMEVRGRCYKPSKLACGAENRRPCRVWQRVPSCNPGLAENFMSDRCVRAGPDHLRRQADQALKDLAPLLRAAVAIMRCNSLRTNMGRLRQRLKARNARQLASWQQRDPCLRRLRQVALSGGYQTFTIGIGGDIQLGIGVNSEMGVAYDVHARRPARVYATIGFLSGFGASVGNDLTVSFYKAPIGRLKGATHGFIYSGKLLGGGGAAIWYSYSGRFVGASAFVAFGVGGEVGVYNRIRTELY